MSRVKRGKGKKDPDIIEENSTDDIGGSSEKEENNSKSSFPPTSSSGTINNEKAVISAIKTRRLSVKPTLVVPEPDTLVDSNLSLSSPLKSVLGQLSDDITEDEKGQLACLEVVILTKLEYIVSIFLVV